MSGQYPYHQQQYGHPDPSSYNPVGANVLPGLGNAGGNMHGMNMTGIVSTGSPLSQAPTLVPMSTPSPGNHSTTSQSTMGAHSNHGNNQSQVPPHHNATGGYQRPMPDPPSNHGWPYWIPAEGISRQVINENVCKSLGNDALVRQRPGVGEFEGVDGYAIDAYRNFTQAMIDDLKRLTKERERDIQQRAAEKQKARDRDKARDSRESEWDRDAGKRRKPFRPEDSPPYDGGRRGNGNTPPVPVAAYPVPPIQDPYRQPQQQVQPQQPPQQQQPPPVQQHMYPPNGAPGYPQPDQYGQYPGQPGYQYPPQVPRHYIPQAQVQPQYPQYNGVPPNMYANQQAYQTGFPVPAAPVYTSPHPTGGIPAPEQPNFYYPQDGNMYRR